MAKGQILANHNPTGFAIMYQSPMRAEFWTDFVDANRDRNIALVGADSSDLQLEYLQLNYVDGLVGQLPNDMGRNSLDVLYELLTTGHLQQDVYGTNLVSYTLIPLHLPPLDLDQNLLGNLRYVGFVSFGVVFLTAVALMVWTVNRRNGPLVRAAQPFFLFLVAGGVVIFASSMVPLSFDDGGAEMESARGQAICMSIPWLAFTGFSLVFAALFSKTWRVNQLFQRRTHFARVNVSERKVLGPLVTLMTCNTVVLVCWTVIDPLSYVRQDHDGTDYWNRVISTYGACQSNHVSAYLSPLAVINSSAVAIASFQAYRARNIESLFSESRCIGLALYFLFQGVVTGIPVVVIVKDMPQASYLVLTLLIFLLSMAILVVIFVPKVIQDRKLAGMSIRSQRRLIVEMSRLSSLNCSNDIFLSGSERMSDLKCFDDKSGVFLT